MNKYGLLPEVHERMKALAAMPKPILTGGQSRVARGLLGWTRADLAKRAKVTLDAVQDIEADQAVPTTTQSRLRGAYEREKVEFPPVGQPHLRA